MSASTVQFNLSDLTPQQVVALHKAGLIEVNGSSVGIPDSPSSSNGATVTRSKTRVPAVDRATLGVYGAKGKIDPDIFTGLHPILRRGARGISGSLEVKALINTLPITGVCTLSPAGYSALATVLSRNGLAAKEVHKGGKMVSRFYAQRTTKDGNPDGRCTAYFSEAGRIRVDQATQEITLVPGKGQVFGDEMLTVLGTAVESFK